MNAVEKMIASTVTGVSIFAVGCGGSSGQISPQGYTMLFPPNASDSVNYYLRDLPSGIQQESPNDGKWSVNVRHMGPDIISSNPTGDFSPVTSLLVPPLNQRGQNTGDSTTTPAFQVQGPDFGSFIDTTLVPDRVVVGGGPHSTWSINPQSPFPMAQNLAISFDAVIKTSEATGTGVAQLVVYFYLVDRLSGVTIACLWAIFDNRPSFLGYAPVASSDTFVAFSTAPFGTNAFGTLLPGSAGMTSSTGDMNRYEIKVEKSNFDTILQQINVFRLANSMSTISTNITDFNLVQFGVIHEVFKQAPGDTVRTGVRVSNLTLWVK
jgi:hypothetical protein